MQVFLTDQTAELKLSHLKEQLKIQNQRSNRLISELKNQNVLVSKIKRKITEFLKNQRYQSRSCCSLKSNLRHGESSFDGAAESERQKSISQMAFSNKQLNLSHVQSDFGDPMLDESLVDIDLDNADTLLDIVLQQAQTNYQCQHEQTRSKSPSFITPDKRQIKVASEWGDQQGRTTAHSIFARDSTTEGQQSFFAFGQNQNQPRSNTIEPVPWIPNDSSNNCSQCKMKFIFLLRRRHHCRMCGKQAVLSCRLVCDKCSPWRDFARGYGDMRVRVCDKCHQKKERMRQIFNQKESIYSSSFQAPSQIFHKF